MIYLQIQHTESDRYRVLTVKYPNPYDTPSGPDLIPLSYVSNASSVVSNVSMFELMRMYRENDKSVLKKLSDTDYQIDFRITRVRKQKIIQLRKYVNRIVTKHMPVVLQVRYLKFMELHEKVTRTIPEQYIYNIELSGRDETVVWDKVSTAIRWMYDTYGAENAYIAQIKSTTNIKVLLETSVNDIVLPAWTGG